MDKVHVMAKEGFKEGKNYDQNRPSYTDEITRQVVKSLYRGPNEGVKYDILEIGAGTGKFTRKLLPYFAKDLTYLASDPSEGFLAVLKEQSPDLQTQIFSAYDIPLPDQCVQNIVCAQCFHWFANKESLDEMTRVLVPHGRILCVWNIKNRVLDWVKEMKEILTTYHHVETPRSDLRKWQSVIEEYGVKCVEHLELPGIQNMEGDKDFVVDHYASISAIALLGEEERKVARVKFRTVLDKFFPGEQKIRIPFFSEFYCAEKI